MCAAKLWVALLALGLTCGDAAAMDGQADALVKQMRQGGLILVFRHAGEKQAAGVGRMLRDLRVPAGDTYSSTGQRAIDTARLAGFGNVMPLKALTDSSAPVSRSEREDRAEVFRALLRERPQRGANIVMVADKDSIATAIGADLANMQEGELVVVRPDVRIERGFGVVGRLTLGDLREHWSQGRGEAALKLVRW